MYVWGEISEEIQRTGIKTHKLNAMIAKSMSMQSQKSNQSNQGWCLLVSDLTFLLPPPLSLCRDMIATGCEDKNVRVYYLATSSDQPLKVFTGHLAKVFHVRWSPLREGILCSGSDDGWVQTETKMYQRLLRMFLWDYMSIWWESD